MASSLGMSGSCPNLAAMALETSPQSPAPVRQIANAIASWIDRLGAVWVEGQVAQLSRRQGMNTVFLTLRDAVADVWHGVRHMGQELAQGKIVPALTKRRARAVATEANDNDATSIATSVATRRVAVQARASPRHSTAVSESLMRTSQ